MYFWLLLAGVVLIAFGVSLLRANRPGDTFIGTVFVCIGILELIHVWH